jgi:hypothetical protein
LYNPSSSWWSEMQSYTIQDTNWYLHKVDTDVTLSLSKGQKGMKSYQITNAIDITCLTDGCLHQHHECGIQSLGSGVRTIGC